MSPSALPASPRPIFLSPSPPSKEVEYATLDYDAIALPRRQGTKIWQQLELLENDSPLYFPEIPDTKSDYVVSLEPRPCNSMAFDEDDCMSFQPGLCRSMAFDDDDDENMDEDVLESSFGWVLSPSVSFEEEIRDEVSLRNDDIIQRLAIPDHLEAPASPCRAPLQYRPETSLKASSFMLPSSPMEISHSLSRVFQPPTAARLFGARCA